MMRGCLFYIHFFNYYYHAKVASTFWFFDALLVFHTFHSFRNSSYHFINLVKICLIFFFNFWQNAYSVLCTIFYKLVCFLYDKNTEHHRSSLAKRDDWICEHFPCRIDSVRDSVVSDSTFCGESTQLSPLGQVTFLGSTFLTLFLAIFASFFI